MISIRPDQCAFPSGRPTNLVGIHLATLSPAGQHNAAG
jgi:hypothetical protein